MTMDEVRMRAIENELREYGGGGPSVSRKAAQEAADLIKNHRWFIFGQFYKLPGMGVADQTEPPCDDDPPDAEEQVVDLMATLEESVRQAKAAKAARQRKQQGEGDVRSTD